MHEDKNLLAGYHTGATAMYGLTKAEVAPAGSDSWEALPGSVNISFSADTTFVDEARTVEWEQLRDALNRFAREAREWAATYSYLSAEAHETEELTPARRPSLNRKQREAKKARRKMAQASKRKSRS